MRTLPHHIACYELFRIWAVQDGFWKIPVIMVLPFLRNRLGEKNTLCVNLGVGLFAYFLSGNLFAAAVHPRSKDLKVIKFGLCIRNLLGVISGKIHWNFASVSLFKTELFCRSKINIIISHPLRFVSPSMLSWASKCWPEDEPPIPVEPLSMLEIIAVGSRWTSL